ncbi:phytoene/squalene synthase family protein [Sphingobacterium bovistauri]|uniref:Phytoene/squalene synthase family protein n=1 Tax=Sphingobacterium bovistauri TaxID=2781959 RepID=A0ABS7Z6C7_9SPHI|nr:phytoene/squalene synthase family protein [Sphingobacterium bovistauri]MCA5005753.1 phytoene/squalene synthase family protein [Sphingobacterium bovistauri]
MKTLYDNLAYKISKCTTQTYSTSFSLGIKALDPKLRPAIYAIYGFVRLADEIVDSFHGYDQSVLLEQLIKETNESLERKISINPILQSFQETVHKYKINPELIDQFLHSMSMDLNKVVYTKENYDEYILGSAEVVGLMCLHVFVEGDLNKYAELKPYAMKLGSAFQKINFLRDLKEDYYTLGRFYFPNLDFVGFNDDTKSIIEKEIENEFKKALLGIKMLPNSSKFGVYLAYRYYWSLFKKIKLKSSRDILTKRTSVPNTEKMYLMMESYLNLKLDRI